MFVVHWRIGSIELVADVSLVVIFFLNLLDRKLKEEGFLDSWTCLGVGGYLIKFCIINIQSSAPKIKTSLVPYLKNIHLWVALEKVLAHKMFGCLLQSIFRSPLHQRILRVIGQPKVSSETFRDGFPSKFALRMPQQPCPYQRSSNL